MKKQKDDKAKIKDLTMLVKQLAIKEQKHNPQSKIAHKAIQYLRAYGLLGEYDYLRDNK
jgi:hypothetical protein